MIHHELLYMPMSAIEHKCNSMGNANATYYDTAKMICELVEMKDCNYIGIISKLRSYRAQKHNFDSLIHTTSALTNTPKLWSDVYRNSSIEPERIYSEIPVFDLSATYVAGRR